MAVAEPARAVDALAGAPGVLEAAMYGRSVHVMTETEDPRAIRERLAHAGLEAERVEAVPPSLEDVFVALVRREGGAREG